jgi:hypothetical protein
MRLSRYGVTYTCKDLRAAGIIEHCCVACHGWDDWSENVFGKIKELL